jgi:hypothetical protein
MPGISTGHFRMILLAIGWSTYQQPADTHRIVPAASAACACAGTMAAASEKRGNASGVMRRWR